MNDTDAWYAFHQLAKVRLTDKKRGSLAVAALPSLSPELTETVFEVCTGGADFPLPPLFRQMDEARYWANHANQRELKAYALAAYHALPVQEQNAFFQHIREVAV